MKCSSKTTGLTVAEKCKTILASSWQGRLNTISAEANGSEEIYTSKVKYVLRRGKPYIWVPEEEMHNVNTMMDERGSFAVSSPCPGSLASLFKSLNKLPARVALTGEALSLEDKKALSATEYLRGIVLSEQRAISMSSYAVQGVLTSADQSSTSRCHNLQQLLDGGEYTVYKFNARLCKYIDGNGGSHEVNLEDIGTCKADPLAPFSAELIDGINRSEMRRRALMLFCFVYSNAAAKDARIISVDRTGFSVLAKVPSLSTEGFGPSYQWKEYRFTFKEEAHDVETFCRQLMEMEEESVNKVSSSSGLL